MSVFEDNANPEVNPLEVLVGEDKKFKSVEDLAKGKLESDKFIDQLQSEMKELREELGTRISVEEALAKVKEQNNEVPSQNTTEERQEVELPDIEGMVAKQLQNLTAQQKANANLSKCDQMMTEKFGERAKEEMARVAQSQGLDLEFVKATAERSPDAFATLMGLKVSKQAEAQPVTGGNVNTAAMNMGGKSADEARLAELKQLMKTDKRKYFSRDVQNEVFQLKSKLLQGG